MQQIPVPEVPSRPCAEQVVESSVDTSKTAHGFVTCDLAHVIFRVPDYAPALSAARNQYS